MKKFFAILLTVILIGFAELCYAESESLPNVTAVVKTISKEEYKHTTVWKKFIPLEIAITNNNNEPVLLSSNTEVDFLLSDNTSIKSASRRNMYRRSRKKDIGRYYSFAIPGSIIAGGVTGITFGLGAPLGAGIMVGMYVPTDKACRTNVAISQDIFKEYMLPIRMEPASTYNVRMLIPKKQSVKEITITNTSFDMKKMYDLKIPVEAL